MNGSGSLHHLTDRQAHALPTDVLDLQLFAACFGEAVILVPPIILELTPFRFDLTPVLQSVKRRIKRDFADAQRVARPLLDALADAEAMCRLTAEDFKDQHVQRALKKIGLLYSGCPVLSSVDGRIAALPSNVSRRPLNKDFGEVSRCR